MEINALGENRFALVTGSGRGIGRALALQLAAAGVHVALVARSADQLHETATHVREIGGEALEVPCDVGDLSQVSTALAHVLESFGKIDILINDAATVEPLGATAQIDPHAWATAFSVNVIAPFAFTVGVLPAMLEQRWGRIVNVSSAIVAFPTAMAGMNAYAATKTALEAHTVNLAAELADTGVTVNAFRPGSVDTAMPAWIRSQDPNRIGKELHDRFNRSHEAGSFITPDASAHSLISRLPSLNSGQIWDASDAL